ncbi:MAG: hypothetical protein PHC83_05060 [Bacteroidales bacterium]|nr:hypothetical protein [Bacteroidales bacterium]MDD4209677.1 hypothetical protein [Bacteroidales bacterium]
MKKIITIYFIFISYSAFTQSESDFKKYYAVIDYIVNNDSLIKNGDSYFNKYKSNNLYLSSSKDFLLLSRDLFYNIYIDNFKYITKEEFNSDFDKYCNPLWKEYMLKDSIEGLYLSDSLYKKLSDYLEKHIKKKLVDNLKWEVSFSPIFYNCITAGIRKTNFQFGATLYFVFFFDEKDKIKEVKIQKLMGL